MKHKENDYLVIRSGNKNVLVLATGKTVGILASTLHLSEVETIKFSPSVDVLCVLGADPEPGASAFGVTVRPYHSLPDISSLPKMHLYGRPEEVRKAARIGLKKIPKIVNKYGLHEAIRRMTALNFVQQSGSKTHAFRSRFKKEEWQDELTVYLDSSSVGEDVYNRLLYGLGESVWTHLLSSKRKVRWLVLFNKLRNVHRLEKDVLATLLEDFIQAGDAKDVKNVVSEDLLPFVDLVFRSIARQRSISVRELELMAQQDSTTVADLWPGEIEVAEGRPDIEKAAMKSASSLFAYTFARHVSGIDVGKTLRKAIKNSLKEVRAE